MLNIVQRYGNKVLLFAIPVLALGLGFDSRAEEKAAEQMYFDFVQNASSGSFDGHTLTLNHVGPTIFFTDRPARISGHTRTSNFVKLWGHGQDSFKTDPPNAVLSMFKEDDTVNSAVVELFDPKLDAATLTYQVKVLSGAIPSKFTEASLFVDRWGRGGIDSPAANKDNGGHVPERCRKIERAFIHAPLHRVQRVHATA